MFADAAAGMIPSIDLTNEVLNWDRESEDWKAVIRKVREACETYGCFFLKYENLPLELQQLLFKTTGEMFDLPLETKLQYKKPTPKEGGYVVSNPFIPLYESFGVYGEEEVRAFEKLMWPQGNPQFCEVINSTNAKMLELNLQIQKMIFESFGILEYYKEKAIDENIIGNLRAMKYRLPKENEEPLGLAIHVDNTIITILCQNSVQGLEVLTKDRKWITLDVPKGALVVIVGDGLQAWTNGRLEAVQHKVVMSGDQERLSCGFFAIPKDGVSIEVPPQLVDEEHPLRYRSFVYSEYLVKHLADTRLDTLEIYAGV
ncbi:putative 2-oxoglutarate-dependent dioxygenase AOP1 [Camellia lanceoleosa]|uniref:2-oxoglutarate-dependent dioxygenase AOP1 n=1 Tax=Camellia lanceoleosa TaxID=1840588 RepID=A0ACC0H1E8_9ERIC|nr:putative 2-oxoglutarate-dependent dioxygenase AOP1 [Camellia lanceoleosa]